MKKLGSREGERLVKMLGFRKDTNLYQSLYIYIYIYIERERERERERKKLGSNSEKAEI